MKLSIIIPAYNEIATIEEIVKRVEAVDVGFDKEIIIIDDASTDGTADVIRRLTGANIKKIFSERNRGKGAAIRTGLKQVTGDIVIIQDADLEYYPDEYPELIKPILDKKADVVFGSRFIGAHRCFLFTHYLGNKIVNLAANILYNTTLSDFMTCYKVFNAGILKDIVIKSERFGFESEITGILFKLGLRIYEVPISYSGRDYSDGKKIKWTDFFVVIWWLLYTRFRPIGEIQYSTLDNLSGNTKYNSYLYGKFSDCLGKRVLELGPGIGNITQLLIKKRELLVALEKSDNQIFYLSQRMPESGIFKVFRCDVENESIDRFRKFNFETAVCINVLEHMKDNKKVLLKINEVIEKDGRLVLIVPAYQWLFSNFDRRLGHFRRYNKKDLQKVLEDAGFKIERIEYFNCLGIFSWWLNFILLKRNTFSSIQLFVFDRIVWLVKIMDETCKNAGLSLLVIAKKGN